MNEQERHSSDVLNHLYQAEMRTLLPRLSDLGLAVSQREPRLAGQLQLLASQAREHRDWLIQEIELGHGALEPAIMDIHSAGLHYASGAAILPMLRRDVERLIGEYAMASRERRLSSSAIELIQRIAARYQILLDKLRAETPRPHASSVQKT